MNIQEAKQISLQVITEHLGGRYSHTDRKGDLWYFSPFRPQEKTASFKINPKLNSWHDFGQAGTINKAAKTIQGSGGDILDLMNDYYRRDRKYGIPETLKELTQGNFAIRGERLQPIQGKEQTPLQNQEQRYKIIKIADRITFAGLKEELYRRRISMELANLYLKQGYILDTVTGKKYNGFLFKNDKGGYEVSIPNPQKQSSFKTCIGDKASTYIPPLKPSNKAEIFEGFWDWLSWLEIKKIKHPIQHSFVLNSNSFAGEVVQNVCGLEQEISYVFLFLDNDISGYNTTHAMALAFEGSEFKVGSMEGFYLKFKDLNEHWVKSIGLNI